MAPVLRISGSLVIMAAIMIDTADAATMHGRGGETYTVDARVAGLAAQAVAALQKNVPGRAIPYLTAALQTRQQPAAAAAIYDMRASAYADSEELERALQDANECLRLNPRHFGGYQTRGRVYRLKGALDKAISEYNKALELNPNFPYLYNNRGVAYSKRGDEQRAIRDYDEAVRRDPNMAEGYANRGISYQTLGQFDKALAEYNKAIRLDPTEGFFYYSRGSLFQQTGRRDDAIRDLSECIRRKPNDPDAYLLRGRAHAAKGAYTQAGADLQKAVAGRPKDPAALNSLAWLKATCAEDSVRDGNEAVLVALEACRLTKWKNSHYLDTLAAAYAEQADFVKAVETERRAMELRDAKSSGREGMESRLRLYQEHKPFREMVSSG